MLAHPLHCFFFANYRFASSSRLSHNLFRFPCAGDAIKTLPPAPLLPGQPAAAVGQLSAATAKRSRSSSRESQADTSDRSAPGRASVRVPGSGKTGAKADGKAGAKAGSQRGTSAPRDATPTTFKERKVGT